MEFPEYVDESLTDEEIEQLKEKGLIRPDW